jgi:hypothetical protein
VRDEWLVSAWLIQTGTDNNGNVVGGLNGRSGLRVARLGSFGRIDMLRAYIDQHTLTEDPCL